MSTATLEEKTTTIGKMVKIENVLPNPLNPRKNDAMDNETLQKAIKERGWLQPVSAYEIEPGSGLYMLIGGHRRRHTALHAGVSELPVFEVPKPKNQIEEMRQILGLQSNLVDWSQYEYAAYVYNLWIELGKPNRKDLAKDLGLSHKQVTEYINVMKYYPRNEIEDGLTKKELTVSSLAALIKWIKAMKDFKPNVVKIFSEDIIRKYMIQKIIDKKASRDALRNTEYPKTATADDIKRFLTDKNIVLDEQVGALGVEKRVNNINGLKISLGHLKNRMPKIKPETDRQKEDIIGAMEETIAALQEKLREIKGV